VKGFTLALVLALSVASFAQSRPDDSMSPLRVDPAQLDRTYRRALWRRNVGIGLAAPGVAFLVLGCVLVGYGANDPYPFAAGVELANGAVVGGVGLVIAIPGAVLWITGQDDMDVTTWRKKQLLRPLVNVGF